MLSSVLNSEQAIEVNIAIMRAFVRLRQMLETNEELNRKFTAVIKKLSTHDKYFSVVFDELKKLTEKPLSSRRQIGFKAALLTLISAGMFISWPATNVCNLWIQLSVIVRVA